jgi:diadenosine tetraphosphatase ApaH/serine/threonine PP2A family protein phosphatase
MEIQWESPSPIEKKMTKKSLFVQAGMARPNEWFVFHEGHRHRPAPSPMSGSLWARAYRRSQVDGKTVYRTYVMYKGS